MSDEPRPESRAEARAVAAYLKTLRALVNEASASRATWIRQLGALLTEVRAGTDPEALAREAGRIGLEQSVVFREFKRRLEKLDAPLLCNDIHLLASSWLDKQMAACEVMEEIGRTGDLASLRETQGLLAEGRNDSRRFSAAYAEMVAWLRERLGSTRRNRATRAGARRFGWLRRR